MSVLAGPRRAAILTRDADAFMRSLEPKLWIRANELGGLVAVNHGTLQKPSVQLLADGDMEAVDTAAWTAGGSAVLSKQTGTPHGGTKVLRVAYGAADSWAFQIVLAVGKIYRMRGWMRSDGTATSYVTLGGTTIATGTSSTSWQYFDAVAVAASTGLALHVLTTAGHYYEFDDLTVTESGFDGAYTACTLARPGRLTLTGAVELDGATSLITIPAGAHADYPKFTAVMLVKMRTAGEALSGKFYSWGGTFHRMAFSGAMTSLVMGRPAATTNASSATTTGLTANVWTMLVGRYDDSGDRICHILKGVNGVLSEFAYSPAPQPSVGTLTSGAGGALILGNVPAVSYTLDGWLDEWALFDKLVADRELRQVLRLWGV